MNLNTQIFYFLNNFASQYDWLDTLIVFCAQWLPFILVGIFILYYLRVFLSPRFKETSEGESAWVYAFKNIFIVLGSTFLVWGFSQIINYFYYSPRPFLVLDDINLLFAHGDVDSFPSGHATFFFSLALMSYYYSPRWLVNLLLVGAVTISIARVASGVHWPMDILGAFVLGGIGVILIKKFILNKLGLT